VPRVAPWSTIVRMASNTLLGGSPVIRSMATCEKGRAKGSDGIRYNGVWV
jgi:hypothetical protein